MRYAYRFFGECFSINRLLVGFGPIRSSKLTSITVSMSLTATEGFEDCACAPLCHGSGSGLANSSAMALEQLEGGRFIRVRYGDGTTFVLNRPGSEIRASWTPPSRPEDVETYLFGQIAGLLLYQRGSTCLHASAVAHRDKALVFAGTAEAGKSTLAATFAHAGHRVLTDDILVIDRARRGFVARPGIPRVGLWPESVSHLWGHANSLPRQVPNWDKRYLNLFAENLFQDTPLTVGAIYVLADRLPGGSASIEPFTGASSLRVLIANKYVTRISNRHQDKRDFLLLSELAGSVPIRRVMRSDRLSDVYQTREAILADFESLERASA